MRMTNTVLKSLIWVLVSAVVVACGSKAPLTDPVTVEDRVGANAGQMPRSQDGTPLQSRDVKSLDLTPAVTDSASNIIYFDFDSYIVKPQFQSVLEAQAKRLKAGNALAVSLAGHTDEQGGREYNLALGQKRAEAVKRALAILGVKEVQMEAVSFGKEKPVVVGAGEEAGAKNRRVEIVNR